MKSSFLSQICLFKFSAIKTMRYIHLFIALSIGMAGCATDKSASAYYADVNRPLAEQGKVKWSEYYQGLYNTAMASNQRDRAQIMARAATMIDAAKAREQNTITEDQFQSIRRNMQTAQAADDDAESARKRAAILAAVQSMNASAAQSQASGYQIVPPARIAGSTTQPLGQQQSITPAATAYWTGKQAQVQTVTYQQGWNCEYNYAGRTFWRTFVGNCPTSVQVQ